MQQEDKFNISIIIPVYNEEGNIQAFYTELKETLDNLNKSYELIFIDDGSSDNSLEIIRKIAKEDNHIRYFSFTRNFGQTAAFACGFEHAKGEIIITIDADGQNVPTDIPELLSYLDKNYDVVCGWRKERKDPFFTRKLPSMFANKLISLFSGLKLHDYGCTLKAFKKEILQDLVLYGEMHRFIPAILHWKGARIIEIPVKHRQRVHGESKYGLMRTFKVLLDLVTVIFLGTFVTKPIYFFGFLGILCYLFGCLSGCIMVYQKWIQNIYMIQNPLLQLSALLVLLGTQFILLGLLAEISIRIYHESQRKRIYITREDSEQKRV